MGGESENVEMVLEVTGEMGENLGEIGEIDKTGEVAETG